VEFPGGELSVGAGEPSGDGVGDGGRRDVGEGFAVEGVGVACEVEVVCGLAAGDVDVGLGSGRWGRCGWWRLLGWCLGRRRR
jgi:hypothetical protein